MGLFRDLAVILMSNLADLGSQVGRLFIVISFLEHTLVVGLVEISLRLLVE